MCVCDVFVIEPTPDWTVEELLQWCLVRAEKDIDDDFEAMKQALEQQLAEGEKECRELHRLVLLQGSTEENADDNAMNVSPRPLKPLTDEDNKNKPSARGNSADAEPAPAKTKTVARKAPAKGIAIQVDVITGLYNGQSFTLRPTLKSPCWVGRSKGKKFKQKGISLPLDLEVSTTHGKFEVFNIDGKKRVFYTDTGSTNGTYNEQGQRLEDDAPYELSTGSIFTLGEEVIRIKLL